jgi:small subunit ribosomal protein S6
MFLLDTNKVSGDVQNAAKQLHSLLERNKAEVLASRPWEERRLAFPIKKHKKGLYYLTYFRSEGDNLAPLERDIALAELILRSMIIKIDPKLVDRMLALARDEHALALQTVQQEPAENGAIEGGGEGHREPRRGRRHEHADKD